MMKRVEELRELLEGVTSPTAVPHVTGAKQKLALAESAFEEAERLAAKAGTERAGAQAAHAEARAKLVEAEAAANEALAQARVAVATALDGATDLIQQHLKLTVVDQDPDHLRSMLDREIVIAVAHQPLNGVEDPANTAETLLNAGVPQPFDAADHVKRNSPKKPEKLVQRSITGPMLAADLVGGFLFGLGVLTFLGQVQERTFLMDATGPVLAAIIGFVAALGASYAIKQASEEAASQGRRAITISLVVLASMMVVEMTGAYTMLQITAANRAFMTGTETGIEPWKLVAMFALSLMFSGVVVYTAYFTGNRQGREQFEALGEWKDECSRVEREASFLQEKRARLIANCEKLKAAELRFRAAHSAALDLIDRALMDCKEVQRELARATEAHERAQAALGGHPAFDDEPFAKMEQEAAHKEEEARARVREVETFLANAS